MNRRISNFSYLKGTKLESFYEKIIKAEYTCDDLPEICKITIRMVIEDFLRYIACIYNINADSETGIIVKKLEGKIPDDIYLSIQIIRMNGVGLTLYRNRNEYKDKQPIELLNMVHKIFCWYLIKTEGEKYNIPFVAPNKMEFDEHELRKIKDDIDLKENQINNLRQKILDLSSQSKNVAELNKIIIAIKNEKVNQEKILKDVISSITTHKKIVQEVEQEKDVIAKSINELKLFHKIAHEDLALKESQLIRAELDYQKVKSVVKNLDEKNSLLEDRIKTLEKLLDLIRGKYERCLELTNRNQDLMESIEFTKDLKLKNKFNHKKILLNNEINNENKFFAQYISNYTSKIEEIDGKIKVFKDILNDRIKTELDDKELVKSFLSLSDVNLRVIYSFVKSYANYNIVNKSRDWLSKYNICNDSFKDELNKSLQNLKNINDNQLKLILHYDLIKMGNISISPIYKRKEFINQYDKLIDSSYNMLMSKKDFNFVESKTTSIKIFYLKKFIKELDEKHKSKALNDALTKEIFDYISEMNQKNGMSISEKYNFENISIEEIQNDIKKKPFEALYDISNFIGEEEIIKVYQLLLRVLKNFSEENIFGDFDIHVSLDKFLKGPYRIHLFTSMNTSILSEVEEVFPIIISEILIGSLDNNNDDNEVCLNSYNELVDIWRKNQQIYSDLFIKRQKSINDVSKRGIEKVELEIKLKNLTQHRNDLKYASGRKNNAFEQMVVSSSRSANLPSYHKYKELLDNASKDTNSNSKGAFSIGSVVEKVNKKIKGMNIEELRRTLIKEAKKSEYFSDEYNEIESIKNDILLLEKEIIKHKKFIKEKDREVSSLTSNKQSIEKKMVAIKKLYTDMHEEI